MSPIRMDSILRITIDEQHDPRRIRFLVAVFLRDPTHPFLDDASLWSEETELLIGPGELAAVFGDRATNVKWDDLREGQVYLLGPVVPLTSMEPSDAFVAAPGTLSLYRIDILEPLKTKRKELYSEVLGQRKGTP